MEREPILYELYSYYRNPTERRVFLLIDCPTVIMLMHETPRIQLLEWGKTTDQRITLTPEIFQELIDKGLMEKFTPKFQ